jgi:hypothetical protein
MIHWLDFIAVIFAAGAIIEVWHKGSIFDTARAYAQAWQDATPVETLRGRLLELLNCPFCKSYHIPVYLFVLLAVFSWLGNFPGGLVRIFIYGLAATRIGNIIDGLLPARLRYVPPIYGDSSGPATDTHAGNR